MDHSFVLNSFSFPASDATEAFALLLGATKGMLAAGEREDRFSLYSEKPLSDFVIAPQYTYQNFLSELSNEKGEEDLHLALLEIIEKTPMIEYLPEDEFIEVASTSYYFPDEGYSGSVDVLAITWALDATLLSIGTSEKWRQLEVEFAKYEEGVPSDGVSYLPNVSCPAHGQELRGRRISARAVRLRDAFDQCKFTDQFIEWNDALPSGLKDKVYEKLRLAVEKKFQGGEPLFKSLDGADGIREIRFSSTQGGAVRILFRALQHDSHAVLVGFVKKSNREGYDTAITAAKALLKKMH